VAKRYQQIMLSSKEIVNQAPKPSAQAKQALQIAFEQAISEFAEEELNYVRSKIVRKVISTATSSTAWVVQVSRHYGSLYLSLESMIVDTIELENDTRTIGAALFYFINPFDVIPDFHPYLGYVDDALVLSDCCCRISYSALEICSSNLANLRTIKKWPRLFQSKCMVLTNVG
jgi:uncharacterized membrane protein YkvA (DUF1232 family)